jgi:DNA polymerase V
MATSSENRTYVAIDLKSFFASVECVDRGLNPLSTNLVVADLSRTEKTICLAVTPSLKSYGIPGRPRLFEVVQHLQALRRQTGQHIDYIVAPPRMARYIEVSTQIYQIYLRYIAPDDIHVYSIDEVFIDVTPYLSTYKMTAHELTIKLIREVLAETGITATAGIGTNMYLCKVAMDIVAKRMPPDADGVRIAELTEQSYRKLLWDHKPLTDFWRVGGGIARKLEMYGIQTMGQLARFSLQHDELLYKLFGVNAEYLIDHAWGYEPCTIAMVKAYRPVNSSLCSGQVLSRAYSAEQGRVVAQEMVDGLALDLIEKRLLTDQIVLTVSYERDMARHARSTINLPSQTSSAQQLGRALNLLYDRIVNPQLQIRRISITLNHIVREELFAGESRPVQLQLFADCDDAMLNIDSSEQLHRERKMQEAILHIKKRYGKNALLKGLNYKDGATARERNNQIGGHKA